MLSEFVALYEQRNALNSLANSEINLFFASVTAAGVAIGFLANFLQDSRTAFLIAACGLLGILLMLGAITFRRVISSRVQIFLYVRAMNRIRRYFAEQDPSLIPFLMMPITDDRPSFRARGQDQGILASFMGNSGLLAVVNSSLSAAFSLTVLALVFEHVWDASTREVWYIVVAGLSFTTLTLYQIHFQNDILRAQDQKQEVQFPRD